MSAPPKARARSNPVRAALRLIAFFFITLMLFIAHAIVRLGCRTPRDHDRCAARWAQKWGRWSCRAFGVRVQVRGVAPREGALIASNHMGYADIIAFAAATPCLFVTKPEVMSVPIVGPFLRFQRIPVVERRISSQITEAGTHLAEVFRHGVTMCVFLEGTSTGGDRVLPFKPALVQPALLANAPVQPVAMIWSASDPAIDIGEEVAYWRPEHSIGPHLWRFLGFRQTRVELEFGEPLREAADRKEAARLARERVIAMLTRSGRTLAEPASRLDASSGG